MSQERAHCRCNTQTRKLVEPGRQAGVTPCRGREGPAGVSGGAWAQGVTAFCTSSSACSWGAGQLQTPQGFYKETKEIVTLKTLYQGPSQRTSGAFAGCFPLEYCRCSSLNDLLFNDGADSQPWQDVWTLSASRTHDLQCRKVRDSAASW